MADDSTQLLHRQAIDSALRCEWDKALELNLKLMDLDPANIDCMNRLAKAYCELGQYTAARKVYDEVLKIDAYNSIAQKNLKKIAGCKKDGVPNPNSSQGGLLSPSLFLQEPGVTKIINLIKVAEPNKLLTLSTGSTVNLMPKSRGIVVTDGNNQYVGALPDDIAFHILKLLKGGNKYQALVKSVKSNGITILVREIYRSKKFRNQASFLDESRVVSYSSDNIRLLSQQMEEDSSEEPSDTEGEII